MCTQRYINQNNKWLINQLRVQIYRSKNFDQPINATPIKGHVKLDQRKKQNIAFRLCIFDFCNSQLSLSFNLINA